MITVASIVAAVSSHYGIDESELISDSRKRGIAWPRQLAMQLASRLTDHSSVRIGQFFHREHATVLHAFAQIDRRHRQDPELRRVESALLRHLLRQDRAWL
jgi:chromosomal replication initiator protein